MKLNANLFQHAEDALGLTFFIIFGLWEVVRDSKFYLKGHRVANDYPHDYTDAAWMSVVGIHTESGVESDFKMVMQPPQQNYGTYIIWQGERGYWHARSGCRPSVEYPKKLEPEATFDMPIEKYFFFVDILGRWWVVPYYACNSCTVSSSSRVKSPSLI